MRRPCFIFSIFTLLLLTTVPAFSQEPSRVTGVNPTGAAGTKQPATPAPSAIARRATADNTKPQIITDEKTNTVRVLIGGKEILIIDAKGIHVNGVVGHIPALGFAAPADLPPRPDRTLTDRHHGVDDGAHRP
jgi:hypothetical protein